MQETLLFTKGNTATTNNVMRGGGLGLRHLLLVLQLLESLQHTRLGVEQGGLLKTSVRTTQLRRQEHSRGHRQTGCGG